MSQLPLYVLLDLHIIIDNEALLQALCCGVYETGERKF